MKKYLEKISSLLNLKVLKTLTIFYGLLVTFNILNFLNKINFKLFDGDNYAQKFIEFNELGYYESVTNGTSIIYNLFIYLLFIITKNVNVSIVILNSLSIIIYLFLAYKIVRKLKLVETTYSKLFFWNFVFTILDKKFFYFGHNDFVMSLFGILIIYQFIFILNNDKRYFRFLLIGFFFALALSVRITAVFFLPVIVFYSINFFKLNKLLLYDNLKKVAFSILTFILTIILFHFPSLQSNQNLSFENKNPKNYNSTWMQKNYYGLQLLENNKIRYNRNALLEDVSFEEVDKYLEKNGKKSLPNNTLDFILSAPVIVVKITFLNILYVFLKNISLYGLIFLVPVFSIFKTKKIFDFNINSMLIYLITSFFIAFICLSFIEYRWLYSFSVFILIAVLNSLKFNNIINKYPIAILCINTTFVLIINMLYSIFY